MPILSCLDYYRPILRILHAQGKALSGALLTERVAGETGLTAEERAQTLSDGSPTYVLRIRQARYRLKSRDLVAQHPNDRWVITEAGQQALAGDGALLAYRPGSPGAPEAVPMPVKDSASPSLYAALPILDLPIGPASPVDVLIGQGDPVDAPLERVDRALREIQEQVESDVLQRLYRVSPPAFERIALKLLDAMGYGKPTHTGRPGDGGIDGFLCADPLELEQVFVQAKRLKRSGKVGPGDIQKFRTALTDKHALKGVFITSGSFTKKAKTSADKQAVRLIDGARLAALMCEFGVGVSRVHVRVIPELNRAFFDDDLHRLT